VGAVTDALDKAEAAARDAAVNTAAVQIALAAVELAKTAQAQQASPKEVCQHHHDRPEFNAQKWIVIGGVATVCSLAFAIASIAIAIGACCATACLLILRSMWRDYLKNH